MEQIHNQQLSIQKQASDEEVATLKKQHCEQLESTEIKLEKEMNERELLVREISLLK